MNRRNVYTGGLLVAAVVAGGLWLSQDNADARALPVKPAHAQAVEKPSAVNDCGSTRKVTVKIPTTEAFAGWHYASLYLQQDYGDPRWRDADGLHQARTSKPGRWEYKRACLMGTGTHKGADDTAVSVKVDGYFDPCQIDGHGGPIYAIGVDTVDDDKRRGRIEHQKVRIHVPAKVLAECVR